MSYDYLLYARGNVLAICPLFDMPVGGAKLVCKCNIMCMLEGKRGRHCLFLDVKHHSAYDVNPFESREARIPMFRGKQYW